MSTEIKEYSKTEAALAELASRYKDVIYPVDTKVGMEAARKGRAELRALRVDLEKTRVIIKEPALRRTQMIDSEARRLTASITELEEPIDQQIKREEKKKEDERLAAEKAIKDKKDAEERAAREAEQKKLDEQRAEIARQQEELAAKQRKQQEEEAAARKKLEDEQRASRERIEAEEAAAKKKRDDEERAAREERERNQAALSEIQGIQQQVIIAQAGRAGVRTGGTIECIEATLAETEQWPVVLNHFGSFFGAAQKAKEDAVAKIRELLAAAIKRRDDDARQKLEQERIDKERRDLEEKQRAAREQEEAAAKKKRDEEEAKEREALRLKNEKLDAVEALKSFVARFGHIKEFSTVVKAINTHLSHKE